MKTKSQRITISLPNYLYDRLKKRVPNRQVSRFISEAVSKELPVLTDGNMKDPVNAFLKHREDFPKLSTEQLLENIRRGRA